MENICKTIFAVPTGTGSHKFRAYFKDLDTPYPLFDTQKEANNYLNKAVRNYLKTKN